MWVVHQLNGYPGKSFRDPVTKVMFPKSFYTGDLNIGNVRPCNRWGRDLGRVGFQEHRCQ